MAKWGKFEFGAFKNFAKTFQSAVDQKVIEQFIEEFLIEMAMRALRKIKKRTPVGVGTPDPGNLRRNWKVGKVERQGNSYVVEIYNETEYAPYVEFGHRAGKNLTKWVEGRFMMTISMKEMEKELPRYLERRVVGLMNDIMSGRILRR